MWESKALICNYKDYRISASGIITIKAQRHKSQERNKEDAILRLATLLKKALTKPKKRKPIRVPKSVKENRLQNKSHKSKTKQLRKKPDLK